LSTDDVSPAQRAPLRPVADPEAIARWIAEFAPVLAAAAAPMVLQAVDGRILHPNIPYAAMMGRTVEELTDLPLIAILHPDDRSHNEAAVRSLLSGEWPEWREQRRYVRPDGTVRAGLLSTRVVRCADGAALGFFTQLEDVTARDNTERRLAESEEMFRLAMEHAPMGMALLDLSGRWARVNRAMCTIVGRSEEELLRLAFGDITHPDDVAPDIALFDSVIAGEIDSYHLDKRYLRPDGSTVWVRMTFSVARHDDGRMAYGIAQVEDLTEERRVSQQLTEQDRRFRMLADGADDVVSARIRVVPELRVEYLSKGVEAIAGRPTEDFYADPGLLPSLVHPDDARRFMELFSDPAQFRTPVELRGFRADGSVLWLQSRGEPIVEDGAVVGVELLCWDITARRAAEDKAAASQRRFQSMVEHAADAITLRDANGIVQYASPAITRILGFTPAELVGQLRPLQVHPDDRPIMEAAVAEASVVPGGVARTEVRARHRDGSERWVALAISNNLDDPDVAGTVLHIHDITERRAAEREIAYQATHDALTGLPNRFSLQRHLEESLDGAGRDGVGVLFLELTGLKPVNDTLGHAKGDAVLAAVARRIAATVDTAGTVGRFGGDEFAVVTTGLGRDALTELAERVVEDLDRPVAAPDGGQVYLAASVGVALADATSTAEQLLANADLAMYDVQRRTGRGVQRFDATLAERATERLALERDLRGAQLADDLRAYYQPVADLGTGRVTAAEALLRWQHATRGLVPPGLFVPVAEETGLIDKLGLWVLTRALLDQVSWSADDVTIAVNLSPRQLYDPALPSHVGQLLSVTGARADRLTLEVTESALIDDRVARPALAALKDLGVGLALDDFGTGYSSLTSLRRYPFDTVKIDRSFVAEITRSTDDLAIVRHVINLAHDLGMVVVAEGVETEEQLRLLTDVGADSAQGYHLGRPEPAAELTRILAVQAAALTPSDVTPVG
jgi:diguanylate cyclase (GGDEF)-like protein/PAS domain S-box-containing protein